MAAEIPNLVKRNGIYYFRCRIPSILTNGRAREVKISLKTGNLTSDLLDVILKVTDYSRWVIAETLETRNKGGANDMNIVTEIRNRITQYIETSLIDQEVYVELPQVFSGAQDSRDSRYSRKSIKCSTCVQQLFTHYSKGENDHEMSQHPC